MTTAILHQLTCFDLAAAEAPTGGDEAYSPAWLVDAARTVLGAIDLDPASCARAQTVVRAAEWYGEQHGVARAPRQERRPTRGCRAGRIQADGLVVEAE